MGSRAEARRLIDQIVASYNAHDTDALTALYQPDISYWSAIGGTQHGVEAVRAHIEHLHEVLPDEQMAPLVVVTDGDVAVVEFESTGTSPGGDSYRIEFTEVFEIRDGRVASIKVYLDTADAERVMS